MLAAIVVICALVFLNCVSTGESEKLSVPKLDESSPKQLAKMKEGVQRIRYLLRNRRTKEWLPLYHGDLIPDDIWIGGGDIKIIVHGYTLPTKQSIKEILAEQNIWDLGEEYATYYNKSNVIILDWTVLSTEPLHRYFDAARATGIVGEAVAEYLVQLSKDGYLKDWAQVHLIGFSLGAHTVGMVGTKVLEKIGVKIGRITGLDPAGPGFDNNGEMAENTSWFLDKSDGEFVDIIHCNLRTPEMSIFGHYGSCVVAGHADFFPDGGKTQTHCTPIADKSLIPCSHMKCTEYMTKSLKERFVACPCENWTSFKEGKCDCTESTGGVYMGDACDPSASGEYYLQMT